MTIVKEKQKCERRKEGIRMMKSSDELNKKEDKNIKATEL